MEKALETLKEYFNNKIPLSRNQGFKLLNEIEKELKDYEEELQARDIIIKSLKIMLDENEKKLKVLEILKAFDFEIEDYTENEHGSIKVKCNRIIVDDEEIDIAKEVLK